MWRSQTRGELSLPWIGYSRLIGATVDQTKAVIAELVEMGICDYINPTTKEKISDVTKCNGSVTLINRRMAREERERKLTRNRVAKYRVTQKKGRCNDDITPPSSSSSSSSFSLPSTHPISECSNTHSSSIEDQQEKTPVCPHQKIINLYHKILPSLPKVNVWNEEQKKILRARWREKSKLEWWKTYFEYIRGSPFLMGEKTDFMADLEWIVRPKNMAKILNGRYHRDNNILQGKVSKTTIKNMEIMQSWLQKKERENTS
jgi:hypothetical protein